MDWEKCNEKKFLKSINVDEDLIDSLIKISEDKLRVNERLELDRISSTSKISLVYDSLREILEAIAIKKGFKIYNHECYCSFLKEICNDEISAEEFNKFRKIRNQINYYGKEIFIEESKEIIKEAILLRKKLIVKYLN